MIIGFPSARLSRQVQSLTRVEQEILGPHAAGLEHLGKELLASQPGEDPRSGASRLNNDGAPLQLCFTASRRGTALRLIGDPGTQYAETELRHAHARTALRRALASTGAGALAPFAEVTLERLLPGLPSRRAAYRHGFLWIAATPQQKGLAFYVEMAPLGQTGGWQAVADWLGALLPAAEIATGAIVALRRHCIVASAGLEGSAPEDARA